MKVAEATAVVEPEAKIEARLQDQVADFQKLIYGLERNNRFVTFQDLEEPPKGHEEEYFIHQEIEKIINEEDVVIFTVQNDLFVQDTEKFLNDHNISHRVIDIDSFELEFEGNKVDCEDIKNYISRRTDFNTWPNTVVKACNLGDYLNVLDNNNVFNFKQLLDTMSINHTIVCDEQEGCELWWVMQFP